MPESPPLQPSGRGTTGRKPLLPLAALLILIAGGLLTYGSWTDLTPEAEAVARPALSDPADIFDRLGFHYRDLRGRKATVPRVLLARLPDALAELPEGKQRKDLFLSVLLPHVLKVNELIAADRQRLLDLRAKRRAGLPWSGSEEQWLSEIASEYDIDSIDFELLLLRVQTIPPSLALTQAAIESGWGGSRFATEGNAMFGQRTWGDNGLVPERRADGETHRVQQFDHLFESVRGYMRNLNTHPAYRELRRLRRDLAATGAPVTGAALAPALQFYSERREAYVEDVLAVMRGNRLDRLDNLRLAYGVRQAS